MDIYIHTDIDNCKQLLKDAGFNISNKKNYFDARLPMKHGRYHGHFLLIGNEVYIDFHYDYFLHFMFLGVEYDNRPHSFFISKLEPILQSKQIAYRIEKSSWFHRRNRAILWGLRV